MHSRPESCQRNRWRKRRLLEQAALKTLRVSVSLPVVP
ncbi:rCG37679 [Rattus norvegicus]|uniref:RCG37679 n=1 Tax=Rattus norvegicus TaxID=10116 RepID=A6JF59_RAT|nr:rCG37679 [Rattus norvegicus]